MRKLILFLALLMAPAYAESKKNIKLKKATFAAGCFWGVEEFFRKIPGVEKTQVGYTGGKTAHPHYDDMRGGKTGHAESVEIEFDPQKVSYEKLLDQFFKIHDPTTLNRQGADIGNQYRSAIFYHDGAQEQAARDFIEKVKKSHAWKGEIETTLNPAQKFWPAEEEHQKYLIKNPNGYDNHKLREISF